MKAFRTQADFRKWLERHHGSEKELMMRLFKVHARHRGIGYREALDEALCWGWIDGVRRAHDEDSFVQRFTPRKARSNWSAVNVKRFRELDAEGRVAEPGRAAFNAWDGTTPPSPFGSAPMTLAPVFLKQLRAHKGASAFWDSLAPGYRRLMEHWIMSAKRDETRTARFAKLLDHARRGERMPLVKPTADEGSTQRTPRGGGHRGRDRN